MLNISKLVILAGGFGTRIIEESKTKPKPMVEIGGKPILWHIMKYYSYYGINEFIICCGYKAHIIKNYFTNYFLNNSDITIDLKNNNTSYYNSKIEPWKIHLIDTGANSGTGGRLKRISNLINKDETFFFTYGDGLADIDLNKLKEFHFKKNVSATVSSVRPPGRWGNIETENSIVSNYTEKPFKDSHYISCGFFVLNYKVFELIDGDKIYWEKEPLNKLIQNNQLAAYQHNGFFAAIDSLGEKIEVEKLIQQNNAPWIKWEQ